MDDRVRRVWALGQTLWLDNLHREMLESGELARLVSEVGLGGVTSNPTIFEKAIRNHPGYQADLEELARQSAPPLAVYDRLVGDDIRRAAEILRPKFDERGGRDGFVSLEVSPRLADDTDRTVEEAERLWRLIDRRNLLIKVPATAAGVPAIARLTERGISVNVTLIFSMRQFLAVADAFLRGMEARVRRGERLDEVNSMASFFVSRVDSAVDPLLPEDSPLRGRIGIANCKVAYARWRELYADSRWRALESKGARPQRLLWGSTGTKNRAYSDVMYVEELIGPETINTVPDATLKAFLDHGKVRATLTEHVEESRRALAELAQAGVDLDVVCERLQRDGVRAFAESYEKLLRGIAEREQALAPAPQPPQL